MLLSHKYITKKKLNLPLLSDSKATAIVSHSTQLTTLFFNVAIVDSLLFSLHQHAGGNTGETASPLPCFTRHRPAQTRGSEGGTAAWLESRWESCCCCWCHLFLVENAVVYFIYK